jgi:hypothetical protein
VRPALAAVLLLVLRPHVAAACATCVSSAFGDRTYNWAYLGLLVMPFALTAVVGIIVAVRMGWRPFGEMTFFSARKSRETT